jgi:hypothetical protein
MHVLQFDHPIQVMSPYKTKMTKINDFNLVYNSSAACEDTVQSRMTSGLKQMQKKIEQAHPQFSSILDSINDEIKVVLIMIRRHTYKHTHKH